MVRGGFLFLLGVALIGASFSVGAMEGPGAEEGRPSESIAATGCCYFKSDLTLGSLTTEVTFYHKAPVYNSFCDIPFCKNAFFVEFEPGKYAHVTPDERYRAAVIYTTSKLVGCREPDCSYISVCGSTYVYRIGDLGINFCHEEEHAREFNPVKWIEIPQPPKCKKSSIDKLIEDIDESDAITITFGAGISHGYVPTLIDFFDSLGLQKKPSQDMADEDSLNKFARILMSDPQHIERAREIWSKVSFAEHKYTPIHEFLRKIIEILKSYKKEIYTYTDNIDNIHHEQCISISESPSGEFVKSFTKKRMTLLALGQSFDLEGMLSFFNHINDGSNTFYLLNKSPDSIFVYDVNPTDDDDVGIQLDCMNGHFLDMGWIEGPLIETLPSIYFSLARRSEFRRLFFEYSRLVLPELMRMLSQFLPERSIVLWKKSLDG